MLTRRDMLKGVAALAAGAFGFAGYAVAEPFRLSVTRYRLSPDRWPSGLRLKIAVLADLHVCEPWMGLDRVRHVVDRTNALKPDLVLLLGDYVAGTRIGAMSRIVADADWASVLAHLESPLGTHAVLGNHDWWDDTDAQRRLAGPTRAGLALQHAGIPVYENDAVLLQKDGIPFWIAGLGDQWAFWSRHARRLRRDPGRYTGVDDLGGTISKITGDAPVILMVHEPDIFPSVPERVSVTLAGHTHGGQVQLFGYAPFVPSRFGQRYLYGHVIETGRHLIVSGGLGCSALPVRFGRPPEIVMLEMADAFV